MKIKEVVKLCVADGVMIFMQTKDAQIISNGKAMYPLYGVPEMDAESISALYNISESKAEEVSVEYMPPPSEFDLQDMAEGECLADKLHIKLTRDGTTWIPVKSILGLQLIDARLLKPLSDYKEVALYERVTEDGKHYFAAKVGMMVKAFIMPMAAASTETVEEVTAVCEFLKNLER